MNLKEILGSRSSLVTLDHRVAADYGELRTGIKRLKELDYRIVLTQGVWDMLHEGHLNYLREARKHGDILIVGVDSDEMTRKRKGPTRPVVSEQERLMMLAEWRCIDILVVRPDTEDMDDLIKAVEPHELITSETTKEMTPETLARLKRFCGEVVQLKPQASTSTTARIARLHRDGIGAAIQPLRQLLKDLEELAEGAQS